MSIAYQLEQEIPTAEEYCHLREMAGLTPRSMTAAKAGLPNTYIGVVVRDGKTAIGMGRIVGDGLCFQVVDIAVLPEYQGKGIGKAIMQELMDALRNKLPAEAYVSLIADNDARFLYQQYGFEETAPASFGMAQWIHKA